MSRHKKKGHSPKTQPWWGKTPSSVAAAMERIILGKAAHEAAKAKWASYYQRAKPLHDEPKPCR